MSEELTEACLDCETLGKQSDAIANLKAKLSDAEKRISELDDKLERTHADKQDAEKQIAELEDKAKDFADGFKRIVDDDRAKDEVHCGCCVELRMKVAELKEENHDLKENIEMLQTSLETCEKCCDEAKQYKEASIRREESLALQLSDAKHKIKMLSNSR